MSGHGATGLRLERVDNDVARDKNTIRRLMHWKELASNNAVDIRDHSLENQHTSVNNSTQSRKQGNNPRSKRKRLVRHSQDQEVVRSPKKQRTSTPNTTI